MDRVIIFRGILLFVFWAFVPLFMMVFLTLLIRFFPGKDLFLRRVMKILLGLGNLSDNGVLRQYGNFDCGSAALSTVLTKMGVKNRKIRLPEPCSMQDIYDYMKELGFKVDGFEMSNFKFLERCVNSGYHVLTLIKVYYPFERGCFQPTRWLLRFLIKGSPGQHWVVVESIKRNRVVLLDPYFGRIVLQKRNFIKSWSQKLVVTGGRDEMNVLTGNG